MRRLLFGIETCQDIGGLAFALQYLLQDGYAPFVTVEIEDEPNPESPSLQELRQVPHAQPAQRVEPLAGHKAHPPVPAA